MPTPITSTSGMRVDAEWPAPEAWQLWQRPGCQPGLGPDAARPAGVRTVTVPGAEDMWDLTVANDHDFCVVTVNTAVLVHDCPLTGGPDWDPVKPPRIQNPELQSIADQLYRPGASIGNGGTGDAIRAGFGHIIKGSEWITNLGSWIADNPGASPSGIYTTQSMLQELISAMAGEGYPGP